MKFLLPTLLFGLLLGTTAWTSAPTPTDPLEKTLLWKVTGRGLKPSYLFGTLHLLREDDFEWTPDYQKAFDASKELVLEVDMSQMAVYAANIQRYAPMRDGSNLKSLLGEANYQEVKQYFEKRPELQSMFEMSQNWCPFIHSSFLYPDMLQSPPKRYEPELIKKAKATNKTIQGLSPHEDYFELIHHVPYQTQADKLLAMVHDLQTDRHFIKSIQKVVAVYKAKELDRLTEMMQQRDAEAFDLNGFLIDDHNAAWLPRILTQSKRKPSFYAIGAGHLGGPNGLIRLLRKKGYKVTPILEAP